jgi:hypothetical protein
MRYDLTDDEWAAIKPMLPKQAARRATVNDRRVLNGIFWVCELECRGATCRTTSVRTPLATIASFAGDERASGLRS